MNRIQRVLAKRGWRLSRIHPTATEMITAALPVDPSDGSYAEAALGAYLKMVFKHGRAPDEAGQLIGEAIDGLGYEGKITFGFSNGDVYTSGHELSGHFTGPYMKIRTAAESTHVIMINAASEDIAWIDGLAD